MSPQRTRAKPTTGTVIALPSRGGAGPPRLPSPRRVPDYRRRARLSLFHATLLLFTIAAGVALMFGLALGVFIAWLVLVGALLAVLVLADAVREFHKVARQSLLALERQVLALGSLARGSSPT